MSRAPPAWPRPDGGGGASAPTSRSPSGPPSRVGARPQRARVRRPSSAPPWGRSTGHRRTAASQAARATAPEARGAARSARSHCADASQPGPRSRVRCSGRVTARSSAGQSSSPPRHPRSCDPALTTRSPESAASRSDPGPTGASLPDRPRSDDQQPAPWLASAPHGAPAYPLFNNPGILNPSPSPGARISPAVNARDAMPAGGVLTVRTRNDGGGEGSDGPAGTSDGGEVVVIEVTDTGTGMSEDVRARVFEPFFTTKPVGCGSGLGLSQVEGFVTQSGGRVAIESTLGQGTSVFLYFPRGPARSAQPPSAAKVA